MPKKSEYPKASFKACLELAKAVEDLGNQCDMDTCAAKLGKKVSGAFHVLVGSAVKFNLIMRKQGKLYLTDTYEKMNLAYTEKEKQKFLKNFFLSVPVFREIYQKYKKVKLPVDILSKALIKEFGVDKKFSQRVARYFVEGAKQVNLLNQNNTFNEIEIVEQDENGTFWESKTSSKLILEEDYSGLDKFVIHIYGKGMNSKMEVNEKEDIIIVDAMINKIKKNLQENIQRKSEEVLDNTEEK